MNRIPYSILPPVYSPRMIMILIRIRIQLMILCRVNREIAAVSRLRG